MRELYGLEWGDSFTDTQIELLCMINRHPKSAGGLGMHGHLRNAMMLLWPETYAGEMEPGVPRWRDELELMTWAWCEVPITAVIGHASAGKTHTFGHIFSAMYLADPLNTIATVTSTHLSGLKKRFWADIVHAMQTNTLNMPMHIRAHDLTMRPAETPKEDKYVIEGIATDRGADAVERIQGNHSRNHRYVGIDEAQGTPKAVFEAMSNLMSDRDFKAALLANPTKKFSEFGTWCEPTDGWARIDPETDMWWYTKRGGICVRLDGMKSPNVKHGRKIFPWLIDQTYVDQVKTSYGEKSPRYWAFVRGWFPPDGSTGYVYPTTVVVKSEKLVDFRDRPRKLASLDPAFEGGDDCVLTLADLGKNDKGEPALNLDRQILIKVEVTASGEPIDYLIAMETIRVCKENNVLPEDYIMDTTGAGRGVAAFMMREWSPSINRLSYGGATTDRPLKHGDPDTAKQLFDRFVTELWWAGRSFMEEGHIGGIDHRFPKLREQLSAREYESLNEKKVRIESKREMKDRLGYSPDYADSFVQLVELMRIKGAIAGRLAPKATGGEHPRIKLASKYSRLEVASENFSGGTI